MSTEELVVITCAAGRQNSFLLPILASQANYKLRLVVHSDSSRANTSNVPPRSQPLRSRAERPNVAERRKKLAKLRETRLSVTDRREWSSESVTRRLWPKHALRMVPESSVVRALCCSIKSRD